MSGGGLAAALVLLYSVGMRPLPALVFFAVCVRPGFAQPAFEVASLKPSPRAAGKDARGEVVFAPNGLRARNVSLAALICAAWSVEPSQVSGPGWLDLDEFDLDARSAAPVPADRSRLMLRALLAERFRLVLRRETKEISAFTLVIDKGGPKLQPRSDAAPPPGRRGFHGDMRQFANLLSVQLSIPATNDPTRPAVAAGPPVPVVDRTGLPGVYDFDFEFKPDGSDPLTLWQRILRDQLGLRLDRRKIEAVLLVVEHADRTPAAP